MPRFLRFPAENGSYFLLEVLFLFAILVVVGFLLVRICSALSAARNAARSRKRSGRRSRPGGVSAGPRREQERPHRPSEPLLGEGDPPRPSSRTGSCSYPHGSSGSGRRSVGLRRSSYGATSCYSGGTHVVVRSSAAAVGFEEGLVRSAPTSRTRLDDRYFGRVISKRDSPELFSRVQDSRFVKPPEERRRSSAPRGSCKAGAGSGSLHDLHPAPRLSSTTGGSSGSAGVVQQYVVPFIPFPDCPSHDERKREYSIGDKIFGALCHSSPMALYNDNADRDRVNIVFPMIGVTLMGLLTGG